MATVPSPRTWAVGELLTAAKLNTDLRDGLSFLLGPPLAVLVKNATQSVSSTTFTPLTWEVEQIDRDGGHSTVTNTSRYTCLTAGWYHLHASIRWDSINFNGETRLGRFRKNGTTELPGSSQAVRSSPNFALTTQIVSSYVQLAVNDYVEVGVKTDTTLLILYQYDSAVDTHFAVRWISV